MRCIFCVRQKYTITSARLNLIKRARINKSSKNNLTLISIHALTKNTYVYTNAFESRLWTSKKLNFIFQFQNTHSNYIVFLLYYISFKVSVLVFNIWRRRRIDSIRRHLVSHLLLSNRKCENPTRFDWIRVYINNRLNYMMLPMDNINKKIENTFARQIQIYELINKIQNVINTESLLPRKFIYLFITFFLQLSLLLFSWG